MMRSLIRTGNWEVIMFSASRFAICLSSNSTIAIIRNCHEKLTESFIKDKGLKQGCTNQYRIKTDEVCTWTDLKHENAEWYIVKYIFLFPVSANTAENGRRIRSLPSWFTAVAERLDIYYSLQFIALLFTSAIRDGFRYLFQLTTAA